MRRLVPPHLEGWQPVKTDGDTVGEEHHLRADGAVLLLDAEGSTELSARLRAQGTLGAEPLDVLLDQIFARVVDVVVACGGYIGHFTGDGVIAAFPGDRAIAVERAISAGRTVLEHLGRLSGVLTPAGPVELAVRASVGAGAIDTFVWRARSITSLDQQNAAYVVVGSAVTEAHLGELLVAGGALGVGPTAAAALPNGPYLPWSDRSDAAQGGDGLGGYVTVDLSQPAHQPAHRPADPISVASTGNTSMTSGDSAAWRFVIPEAFDEAVHAEFRDATVLFIELREWPDVATVVAILEHAATSGGHVSNILRTSGAQRGITFMLLWGAPAAHPDAATRALDFVAALQHEIGVEEFRTGAVSSNMFVGFVGSATQSTYTAMGAPVNLASRLCSLARWGEIRVTDVFDDAVPPHWTVETVDATLYRGFSMPLVTRSLRPSGVAPER